MRFLLAARRRPFLPLKDAKSRRRRRYILLHKLGSLTPRAGKFSQVQTIPFFSPSPFLLVRGIEFLPTSSVLLIAQIYGMCRFTPRLRFKSEKLSRTLPFPPKVYQAKKKRLACSFPSRVSMEMSFLNLRFRLLFPMDVSSPSLRISTIDLFFCLRDVTRRMGGER